jgi:hypothetical protein
VNTDWKRGKGTNVTYFIVVPGGTEKTTENLSQDSLSAGRDSNT